MSYVDQHLDKSKIVSTVDSVVSMAASLRTEEAVGALPCVEGDQSSELLMCFTDNLMQSGLWLVASKEAYQEPRVRKFMKFIGEKFPQDGRKANF